MRETGERWKNVSMELRCVQSMLEEVVAYWRRWNTLADEFESWLDRAYGLLDLPEEDKMEYFQVLCQRERERERERLKFSSMCGNVVYFSPSNNFVSIYFAFR